MADDCHWKKSFIGSVSEIIKSCNGICQNKCTLQRLRWQKPCSLTQTVMAYFPLIDFHLCHKEINLVIRISKSVRPSISKKVTKNAALNRKKQNVVPGQP